jgi:hypothetical protein
MKFELLLSFTLLCTVPSTLAHLLHTIHGHAQDIRVRFADHQKMKVESIQRGQHADLVQTV